jgi:hypothetical protein
MRINIIVMRSVRQTLTSTLASIGARWSARPLSDQKTPYELELDRLLNASETEPDGVRRRVAMLKRRAWWV